MEAEYLIGLAGKKLQLERDRASALALMQSADRALSQSGNSNVFAVRKWDGIPEAMLASGQDIYIKQTFELMLEQAKLAVVSGDQNLYQTSLTNAMDWVQRYAVMDTVAAETILTEINELAGIDLNPSLPLINESLSLLRRLIASEQ